MNYQNAEFNKMSKYRALIFAHLSFHVLILSKWVLHLIQDCRRALTWYSSRERTQWTQEQGSGQVSLAAFAVYFAPPTCVTKVFSLNEKACYDYSFKQKISIKVVNWEILKVLIDSDIWNLSFGSFLLLTIRKMDTTSFCVA